ncbi:class I SAM-dependent methyltransferase, partial [Desulfococcus sp.]|uniref:class I SAM-dependent methyltransferase n=1 Tax=Desulfococcus sp. TaxID=2025834 RepID=UPI003593BA7A
VTATTISREQHRLASERVARAGLADRVTILFQDYRDLAGSYDKLVSIEMIEAVGHHFYDDFFRVCERRLKPDGAMVLQAITIRDDRYRAQLDRPDFIKRHIFPGACLPSIAAISDSVARVTDLKVVHLEDITPHYARTLQLWRERFFANLDRVRELGYPEKFIRMWEFYLCYCEGSFLERYIGDVQMILTRPLNRMAPILPSL